MTIEEIQSLKHGLYVINWAKDHGGGQSLASVGSERDGRRWFAPTNWTSGSTLMEGHRESIQSVRLILASRF